MDKSRDEALADTVRQYALNLNGAIAEAQDNGLSIEVELMTVERPGKPPSHRVFVKVARPL